MLNGRGLAALVAAFLLAALPAGAGAAELAAPEGAVVVTVAGAIENTNRGAFDPDRDLFLKYHDRSFTHAAAFDRDRKSVVSGKRVSVRLDAGGGRNSKKKKKR